MSERPSGPIVSQYSLLKRKNAEFIILYLVILIKRDISVLCVQSSEKNDWHSKAGEKKGQGPHWPHITEMPQLFNLGVFAFRSESSAFLMLHILAQALNFPSLIHPHFIFPFTLCLYLWESQTLTHSSVTPPIYLDSLEVTMVTKMVHLSSAAQCWFGLWCVCILRSIGRVSARQWSVTCFTPHTPLFTFTPMYQYTPSMNHLWTYVSSDWTQGVGGAAVGSRHAVLRCRGESVRRIHQHSTGELSNETRWSQ